MRFCLSKVNLAYSSYVRHTAELHGANTSFCAIGTISIYCHEEIKLAPSPAPRSGGISGI